MRVGVHLLLDHIGANRTDAHRGGCVVLDLEPDKHAVPDRRAVGIGEAGMILLIPRVELQDEVVADI